MVGGGGYVQHSAHQQFDLLFGESSLGRSGWIDGLFEESWDERLERAMTSLFRLAHHGPIRMKQSFARLYCLALPRGKDRRHPAEDRENVDRRSTRGINQFLHQPLRVMIVMYPVLAKVFDWSSAQHGNGCRHAPADSCQYNELQGSQKVLYTIA